MSVYTCLSTTYLARVRPNGDSRHLTAHVACCLVLAPPRGTYCLSCYTCWDLSPPKRTYCPRVRERVTSPEKGIGRVGTFLGFVCWTTAACCELSCPARSPLPSVSAPALARHLAQHLAVGRRGSQCPARSVAGSTSRSNATSRRASVFDPARSTPGILDLPIVTGVCSGGAQGSVTLAFIACCGRRTRRPSVRAYGR